MELQCWCFKVPELEQQGLSIDVAIKIYRIVHASHKDVDIVPAFGTKEKAADGRYGTNYVCLISTQIIIN